MFKRLRLKLYVIIYYAVFSIFALILAIPYGILRLLNKLPSDLDEIPTRHIN
jgi:hypothetical protein